MIQPTWKYIEGPVIHAVVTYTGDRSVFTLECTGERVSRVSYNTADLTCLGCLALARPSFIGWYSYQEVGVAVYNPDALEKMQAVADTFFEGEVNEPGNVVCEKLDEQKEEPLETPA